MDLGLDDLASLLEGRITNWKLLGGCDTPIVVGVRGDGVFLEAANFLLSQGNISIATNAFMAKSYEDLAAFGADRAGALLIGLRGLSAGSPRLREVPLNGRLLATSTNRHYPLCGQVTLLLRQNEPRAIALGRRFADGFAQRMREDGLQEQGSVLVQKLEQALARNHGRSAVRR
jgi:hypothetical protein